MISIIKPSNKAKVKKIKERSANAVDYAIERVNKIVVDVKKRGDEAVISYTKKFDNVYLTKNNIRGNKKEIKETYKKLNPKTVNSLKIAAANIARYAKYQLPSEWKKEINKGIFVGQIVRPLDSVGCYVPGGNYPLASSVLMAVIPAKVAGVKEIIVCCPKITKEILAACEIAGADKVFRVGGAQAIAAMAYGTETIPKVSKIVCPGNIYVTAAKKLVFGDVGIDFLAGP